ncbi:MAG TPA: metal-dependent hydrolase [Polyangiaceae bacterium]
MASLGHIAVGMAAGRAWATSRPARAMVSFAALSMLPDVDVLGMAAGVPYGAPLGHRGATHSLVMAAVLGLAFALLARGRGRRFLPTALVAAAVAASHGLLDAMTDGGRGVALLWPFTTHRYFLPWRPIPVAPIGAGFLSAEGLAVAGWELVVFLPFFAYALWPRAADGPMSR